ncbi:MAG TPA: LacI family DNA-binding transcriptional regulator [Acidimicrobiales bacterium]|nr:LacI family DNA-binding transcriptional regulator [Acidimicrobiales bacterium]
MPGSLSGAVVTLADVAAAAGVSVPTVSKVVNSKGDVAPATRDRVERALVDAGYTRPASRRQRATGFIDLVFDYFCRPWATEIIAGVEEVTRSQDYRLVVTTAHGDDQEERWLTRLAQSGTDGVILGLTDLSPRHRKRLMAMQVPMVIIDPVGQPDPKIPSIGASNWAGALQATDHLVELGHSRIGAITGPPSMLCSRARLDGYRAALDRAGIELDSSLVAEGTFHFDAALAAASKMLSLGEPPSAIFASSDVQAMGVYEAARQVGLRIPDDLSVVGFDDLPVACWVPPPLTTVRQPFVEMASLAVRVLLDPEFAVRHPRLELATSLVVRASTGPPRSVRRQAPVPIRERRPGRGRAKVGTRVG